MILSLRANNSMFKPLVFRRGLNIVLADITEKSTQHDSRNGAGKSTVIEIIQYCLGSRPDNKSIFFSDQLVDWSFTLEFEVSHQVVKATRSIAERNRIYVDSEIPHPFVLPSRDKSTDQLYYSVNNWNMLLGDSLFEVGDYVNSAYKPTFRALVSYFTRRGMGGFLNPFEYYARQKQIEIQAANTYLLGLDCHFVSDMQEIKDSQATLSKLQITNAEGMVQHYLGNIGSLNSRKAALQSEISQLEDNLSAFRVHPQYFEIELLVNKLTCDIQEAVNSYTICKKTINTYEQAISSEVIDNEATGSASVIELYREAGVFFPEAFMRRLEDVTQFHAKVISNRRDYLSGEIANLNEQAGTMKNRIAELDNERAKHMEIIRTHGALNEYVAMTTKLADLKQSVGAIETKIDSYNRFQKGSSALKIRREQIVSEARTDITQRDNLQKAMSLFHENSKYLYGTQPGNLEVDITANGYTFDISIDRAKSNGVSHMKIFCYDLMLLEHRINRRPDFLIHDSTIFEGVDERQIHKALELAYKKSLEDKQYICMMNSDNMPYRLFSDDFRATIADSVIGTLTDSREDGGVLGVKI